jgi:hypothetical protein
MPGSSAYPGALDDFALASPTNLGDSDIKGRTHSERHDDVEAAVEAIEAELGTDPAGASATVKARFDVIEAAGWVTSTRILDGTIATGDLADDAVTPAKISFPLLRSALYLPGTSGNYASIPDSAAVSITGNIDIVALVKMNDWTPTGVNCIASRWHTSTPQRSWRFEIATTGRLSFTCSADGTSTLVALDSGSSMGFTDGTWNWVRFYRNSTTGAYWFGSAAQQQGVPTSWTEKFSGTSTTGALFDGTATLDIGAIAAGTNNLMVGRIAYCEVRNGIGGTPVAVFDFRNGVAARHRDEYSNVITVNGSAWAMSTEEVTA